MHHSLSILGRGVADGSLLSFIKTSVDAPLWPARTLLQTGADPGSHEAATARPPAKPVVYETPGDVARPRHRHDLGFGGLRQAICDLDGYLSVRSGVRSYTDDSSCLFRLALTKSGSTLQLPRGGTIRPGDPVCDLHLWNEHISPICGAGPDFAWARRLSHQIEHSLHLLSVAIETDPDLRAVKFCRARTNFVGLNGSGESLTRLIGRFGFEELDEGTPSIPARVHDALENILVGALVWTHNPQALRRDKIIRRRRSVWISVERLIRLHGPARRQAPPCF